MNDELPCQNDIHNHNLTGGYLQASYWADERLDSGWDNVACPDCGKFGWIPPKKKEKTASGSTEEESRPVD